MTQGISTSTTTKQQQQHDENVTCGNASIQENLLDAAFLGDTNITNLQLFSLTSVTLDLNCCAIHLLRNGQTAEALETLDWAMQNLKRITQPSIATGFEYGNSSTTGTLVTSMGSCQQHERSETSTVFPWKIPCCVANNISCVATTPSRSGSNLDAHHESNVDVPVVDVASVAAYLSHTTTRHDLTIHSVHATEEIPTTIPKTSIASTVSMTNEMDLERSPGNFFSLYNRPFVVHDHWREIQLDFWTQSLPHIPVILYYNAGLCCHRMAIQCGCQYEWYIKALHLYQTARLLLEQNATCDVYLTELDIVQLALINNMGHIYSHFNNFTECLCCLECMRAIFTLSKSKLLMTKDEYLFFHLNITMFTNRWPILAAAA